MRQFVIRLIFTAAWSLVFRQHACVAADYSIDELVAGYSETVSSIDTLYVEYEERFTDPNGNTVVKSCVYARDGVKWHYATTPVPDDDATTAAVEETVTCSDGKQAFLYYLSAGPDANGSDDFGALEISDTRPEPMISPDYAIGVKLPELSRSYPSQGSLIKLFHAQPPLPIRQLAGAEQGKFVISPIEIASSSTGAEYSVEVRVDPEHSFLPASVVVEFSKKTKLERPSHRDWSLEWNTQSFQQCLDHREEAHCWFPRESKFTQTSGLGPGMDKPIQTFHSFIVHAVEINKDLEPTLFNPRIPNGTTIVDSTAKGKGKVSIQGGTNAVDVRARQLAAKAASSDAGLYRAAILAINILVLGAAVMYFFFVRKAGSR